MAPITDTDNKDSKPIDEREIRGITARVIIYFGGGVILILVSAITTFFAIKSGQKETQDLVNKAREEQFTYAKNNEDKFNQLDKKLETTEIQNKTLELKIVVLEEQIKNLQKH